MIVTKPVELYPFKSLEQNKEICNSTLFFELFPIYISFSRNDSFLQFLQPKYLEHLHQKMISLLGQRIL
jgi:hypothetical protein